MKMTPLRRSGSPERSSHVVTRFRVTTAGAADAAMLMVPLVSGCAGAPDSSPTVPSATSPTTSLNEQASPGTTGELGAPALPPGDEALAQPNGEALAQPYNAAAAVPVASSVPVRIQIPSIGVDSDLMGLGLQSDGTMEVPQGGFPGGWYTGSPTPGELGPSIIAGHVDWGGSPGVFYRLRELASGDSITVTREDGSVTVFVATDIRQYPKAEFPTQTVYGDIDHAGLRLITCGGAFDSSASSYDDNIIAYAALSETIIP